jgi:O-methyltransferase
MASKVQKILKKFNYEVRKVNKPVALPTDFEEFHQSLYRKVSPFTMTGPERIFSLIEAIRYIEKNAIEGAIVECGVWKGGSMMAVAETLLQCKNPARDLFLYDTFEGMPPPGELDKTHEGIEAARLLDRNTDKEKNLVWAYSSLEDVKAAMRSTGYPENKIQYIPGKVEETIPGNIPGKIALLRLDTDWYESTRHELVHLFPLLRTGGILILDDYGYWQGARRAADEYFQENKIPIFLARIDDTGRIAIKQ